VGETGCASNEAGEVNALSHGTAAYVPAKSPLHTDRQRREIADIFSAWAYRSPRTEGGESDANYNFTAHHPSRPDQHSPGQAAGHVYL